MSEQLLTIIGSIIGAAIAAFAAVKVAQIGSRSAREGAAQSTTVQWAADLVRRVESLEDDVADLKAVVSTQDRVIRSAATFIDRIGLWIIGGLRGQPPAPPSILHEHIDTSLWTPADDGQPADPNH